MTSVCRRLRYHVVFPLGIGLDAGLFGCSYGHIYHLETGLSQVYLIDLFFVAVCEFVGVYAV